MSNINTFTFNQKHRVRIEINANEPWFCLRDVCDALEIKQTSKVIASDFLCSEGVKSFHTLTNGGGQSLSFVNEPNLYRVIFRSNKAEAKKFQDWVFNEVLPTIRKTGSYHTQPQQSTQLKTLTVDEIHAKVEAICKNFSIEPETAMMQLYIHMHSTLGLKHSMNINNIQKDLGNPSPEHLAYFTVLLDKLEKHALKMRQVCENTEMEFICRFINPYESRKHINPNHIPEWFRHMTICGKRPQEVLYGNGY